MTSKASLPKPRIALLYHFMYPDDVVSAHHFDGLAEDLATAGWEVEALPCNRGCRDESKSYKLRENHEGVQYNRIWRPAFSQKRFLGRLLNSAWMIANWSMLAFRPKSRRPDAVIIGTDPIFGLAAAIPLRFFARDMIIAHWCFDLHPEAAVSNGAVNPSSWLVRFTQAIMKRSYQSCDLIADLGPCMRRRLQNYGHNAIETEMTPWALSEPEAPIPVDASTRKDLFGDAKLGLLYSGNFGEAHTFAEFLALARSLRERTDIHFCFAVRGNQADRLRAAVTDADTNISFAGFAKIEDLEKRLGAADIHLASLKAEWAGIAVPSKFFGSLASGRPVLFAGPRDSAIGNWIKKHDIGWALEPDNISAVRILICRLADRPEAMSPIQRRCLDVYQQFFSRRAVTQNWDSAICNIIAQENSLRQHAPQNVSAFQQSGRPHWPVNGR